MMTIPYTIPANLIRGFVSGEIRLYGAILKDVANGQILGHVQQTSGFVKNLSTVMGSVANIASASFAPLSAISVGQNVLILRRLAEMNATLALLQTLQVASLAVSGLGLGVSVAGFAMMRERLKGIDASITALTEQVSRITSERRQDELRRDLRDIASEIDTVATLESRKDKAVTADSAQRNLLRLAGQVERHMFDHYDLIHKEGLNAADLDFIWALAAEVRLCHEMSTRTFYQIDDLGAAPAVSQRQAERFMGLTQRLMPPDSYIRLATLGMKDPDEIRRVRDEILPMAKTLTTGFHDTVFQLSAQGTLAQDLHAKGMPGPDYLQHISSEENEPLLVVPSPEFSWRDTTQPAK